MGPFETQPPATFPEPPFRATINSLTPDGVGELAFEGGKVRFGASACQGFRPAMGLEVEVLALAPHVLGGVRPSALRLLTDQATYAQLLDAAVAKLESETPKRPKDNVQMATPRPRAKPLELPELSVPPPAGHRHVVVVRFMKERDDGVFVREVTWDGPIVRGRAYEAKRTTPDTPITTLMKYATRYDAPAQARRALDSEVVDHTNSFEVCTHVVKTLPLAQALKLANDAALEKAFFQADTSKKREAARLADWLQTQGDVRGELAAVFQQQGEASALQFIENNEALLGEASHALGTHLSLKWSHGFVTGARLKRGHSSRTPLDRLTRGFLASPLGRFITDLRFGLASSESYENENDWSETLREVVESARGPFIEKLEFNDFTDQECRLSLTPFGDFSPFWSKLPRLEHLHIRSGAGGVLNDLELPSLKTFIRESSGLGGDELRSILRANWPKLERLELWFGRKRSGAKGSVELIQPLLDARVPAGLKHLGLINCEFSAQLLRALLKSKILPKLEVLDLSRGVLTDEDVQLLVKHASKLKHLTHLELSDNLLNEAGPELEAALPNVFIGEQRYDGYDEAEDEDDDDDDDRYSDVGE